MQVCFQRALLPQSVGRKILDVEVSDGCPIFDLEADNDGVLGFS